MGAGSGGLRKGRHQLRAMAALGESLLGVEEVDRVPQIEPVLRVVPSAAARLNTAATVNVPQRGLALALFVGANSQEIGAISQVPAPSLRHFGDES